MKKYFFIFFLSIAFFSSSPKLVSAQETKIESCFGYYQFGEVKVHLNTKKTSYGIGEKIELLGAVVNKSALPLLNITVYAHLKRINEQSYPENGHFLVDRLTLIQN